MLVITTPKNDAARVIRAAKRVGLVAKRSRWRRYSTDNCGGWTIIDPTINFHIAGERFQLTAQQVIDFCRARLPQIS
jgi:hypothetical protein